MDKLYNEKEAADYLVITKKELNEFIQDKKLPAYKIGGQFLRFNQKDLDAIKFLLSEDKKEEDKYKKQEKINYPLFAKLKDYVYYNDFYIIVAILIVILLALIFKISF